MGALVLSILVLVLAPGGANAALALEYDTKDGAVRGRRGEQVVWENQHDRQRHYREAAKPGRLLGPVLTGDSVYYTVAAYAYRVDPDTGVVRQRIPLPGPARALTVDGPRVLVTAGAPWSSRSWSRAYPLGPDAGAVPFFPVESVSASRMTLYDAEGVLRGLLEADGKAPKPDQDAAALRRTPEMKPYLETAVKELERLAQRDPTNPWYRYQQGVYLSELGREADGTAAFRSVLALAPEYDFELLPLTLRLDAVDRDLGREAFRRGMRFLMARGHEPEMVLSLLGVLELTGFARPKGEPGLDQRRDLDRLNEHGERIWDLAPHGYSAWMFQALATANRDAGRADAARTWAARVEAMPPYVNVDFGAMTKAGTALNLCLAALVTLWIALIVRGLRYLPVEAKGRGFARWNPFVWWTRGEIVGFLVSTRS